MLDEAIQPLAANPEQRARILELRATHDCVIDEVTAIQLATEAKERRVAFADIQGLADHISRPPYNWTTDLIWDAYAAVDVGADRVRQRDHRTLTDLDACDRPLCAAQNGEVS